MITQHSVVVSRHPAAIEFICRCLSSEGLEAVRIGDEIFVRTRNDVDASFGYAGQIHEVIPVITGEAMSEDVADKVVYGNLPLHLACLTRLVVAIEFSGKPPRGAEYTLADMIAAGARLARYVVRTEAHSATMAGAVS